MKLFNKEREVIADATETVKEATETVLEGVDMVKLAVIAGIAIAVIALVISVTIKGRD
jgi:hypothetical protein